MNGVAETPTAVCVPLVAVMRNSAVVPAVSVVGVQLIEPAPYWSSATPVAMVVQLAPLLIETSTVAVGAAAGGLRLTI